MKIPSRSARKRTGLSLIEVMIALSILGGVLLGMGHFSVLFARTVTEAGTRSTASDLVADRIESVKANGRYDNLETVFNGTESAVSGFSKFSRTTLIRRIGGAPSDSVDYKVVTVTVRGPRLTTPVKKSTIISNF